MGSLPFAYSPSGIPKLRNVLVAVFSECLRDLTLVDKRQSRGVRITLNDRLLSGPLPLKQALKIAIEMADALDKAHVRGIIHRDLKPGNIMLTKSGTSKLMDFGWAKPTSSLFEGAVAGGPPLTPTTPTMSIAGLVSPPALVTEQGAIVGTLLYLAPEALRGEQADVRSDIFSFGRTRAFTRSSRTVVGTIALTTTPLKLS
jgi:serine/threonine protein kinase